MSLHQRDQQPHQTRAPLDRWCRATNKGKCPTAVVKFEIYGNCQSERNPLEVWHNSPWKVTEIQVGKACLPTTILHGGELLNFMGVHLERWLKPVCLVARYLQTWGTCQVGRPLGRLRWPRKAVGPFRSTSQRRSYLLGTNISHPKVLLKMIFLFPRWDMLVLRSFFKGCGMHWNGICQKNISRKKSKTRFHFEFDMIFSTVSFCVFDGFFLGLTSPKFPTSSCSFWSHSWLNKGETQLPRCFKANEVVHLTWQEGQVPLGISEVLLNNFRGFIIHHPCEPATEGRENWPPEHESVDNNSNLQAVSW